VIDSILLAYSFMVAGLFFPTLGALFWRRASGTAAFWSIVFGGGLTVALTVLDVQTPVDPVFYGLGISAAALVLLSLGFPDRRPMAG
jgi:SSS family solute:Na+ symporter